MGEILKEIQQAHNDPAINDPFDRIRRSYLPELYQYTGRATILYSTAWTQSGDIPPQLLSIADEDVQGFMETVYQVDEDSLDLILHSPGGSPEATEPIVQYLRDKFSEVRIFVPHAAMSAASMLCCAADEIVMGRQSSLGPIDTQLILNTETGQRSIPAQAILDQFDKAREECQDPENLGYWTPILRQYGPSLLIEAEDAIELARNLARNWAEQYMFAQDPNPRQKAEDLVSELSDYSTFKSHSRHIHRDRARDFGFNVTDLEDDQDLQDKVLSVYHATTHTHSGGSAVKIIENHLGRSFIKHVQLS